MTDIFEPDFSIHSQMTLALVEYLEAKKGPSGLPLADLDKQSDDRFFLNILYLLSYLSLTPL